MTAILRRCFSKISIIIISINDMIIKRYYISIGIELSDSTTFNKWPIIVKTQDARIYIGNKTYLNSSNNNYHLNMHNRCKLVADREKAVIKVGDNSRIHGACIHTYKAITIGNNCLIAANTQIIDGNGHALSFDDVANRINTSDQGNPIHIGDNVWIGANSIILGGTTIGEGTIISAGSVVKGNIPAMSIYGGNPAKLIKSYT